MRTLSRGRALAVLAALVVGAATAAGTAGTAVAASAGSAPAAVGPAALGAAPAAPGAAPAAEVPAPAGGNCPQTAAQQFGWGQPTRHSDFDGTTVPKDWHPYGPEPGHAKNGTRTPAAVTVGGGVMSINGTQDGTTGAVSWHPGQRYGRWEACVRSDEGPGGLHSLLLLWPVAENFPTGGEIDWMEIGDGSRQKTEFFLHYGSGNQQEAGSLEHDATKWTAWALEWTPQKITAYVNGKAWYSTSDTSHFPPGPMNMTMQLDYFGNASGPSAEHMDWASQWALPESEPATLSLAPGAPATGQPKDYPDRKPHKLTDGESAGTAPAPAQGTGTGDGTGPATGTGQGTATPSGTGQGTPGGRPRLLHPEQSATSPGTGTPVTGTTGTAPGTRPRTLHPTGGSSG